MGTNSLLCLWSLLFWIIVVSRKWLSVEPSQKQSGRNLATEILIEILLLFARSSLAHNGPLRGFTGLILCCHIFGAFSSWEYEERTWGLVVQFHRHALNYFELCWGLQDLSQGQRSLSKVATVSVSLPFKWFWGEQSRLGELAACSQAAANL